MRASLRTTALGALVLGLFAGCEPSTREDFLRPSEAASAAPVEAPRVERLSDEANTLYLRTLVRDGQPTCAALTAGLREPLRALLEVTAVTAPPRSSVRAATCVVQEHASEAEPHLLRWVRERSTRGLALVVANNLDRLDEGLATRVVDEALRGENSVETGSRIADSTRYPSLRALGRGASLEDL